MRNISVHSDTAIDEGSTTYARTRDPFSKIQRDVREGEGTGCHAYIACAASTGEAAAASGHPLE